MKTLPALALIALSCLTLSSPAAAQTPDCERASGPFAWSCSRPIPGIACTQIVEPADPHTWSDNYFCASRDLGIRWSYAGPIAGMRCTQMAEPADPDTWSDNYLCVPGDSRAGGVLVEHAGPLPGSSACSGASPPTPTPGATTTSAGRASRAALASRARAARESHPPRPQPAGGACESMAGGFGMELLPPDAGDGVHADRRARRPAHLGRQLLLRAARHWACAGPTRDPSPGCAARRSSSPPTPTPGATTTSASRRGRPTASSGATPGPSRPAVRAVERARRPAHLERQLPLLGGRRPQPPKPLLGRRTSRALTPPRAFGSPRDTSPNYACSQGALAVRGPHPRPFPRLGGRVENPWRRDGPREWKTGDVRQDALHPRHLETIGPFLRARLSTLPPRRGKGRGRGEMFPEVSPPRGASRRRGNPRWPRCRRPRRSAARRAPRSRRRSRRARRRGARRRGSGGSRRWPARAPAGSWCRRRPRGSPSARSRRAPETRASRRAAASAASRACITVHERFIAGVRSRRGRGPPCGRR
jgi:hypothetical protein